jgi:hypothetical protein
LTIHKECAILNTDKGSADFIESFPEAEAKHSGVPAYSHSGLLNVQVPAREGETNGEDGRITAAGGFAGRS